MKIFEEKEHSKLKLLPKDTFLEYTEIEYKCPNLTEFALLQDGTLSWFLDSTEILEKGLIHVADGYYITEKNNIDVRTYDNKTKFSGRPIKYVE